MKRARHKRIPGIQCRALEMLKRSSLPRTSPPTSYSTSCRAAWRWPGWAGRRWRVLRGDRVVDHGGGRVGAGSAVVERYKPPVVRYCAASAILLNVRGTSRDPPRSTREWPNCRSRRPTPRGSLRRYWWWLGSWPHHVLLSHAEWLAVDVDHRPRIPRRSLAQSRARGNAQAATQAFAKSWRREEPEHRGSN